MFVNGNYGIYAMVFDGIIIMFSLTFSASNLSNKNGGVRLYDKGLCMDQCT